MILLTYHFCCSLASQVISANFISTDNEDILKTGKQIFIFKSSLKNKLTEGKVRSVTQLSVTGNESYQKLYVNMVPSFSSCPLLTLSQQDLSISCRYSDPVASNA